MSRRAPGTVSHHAIRRQWRYGPTPSMPLLLRPGAIPPVETVDNKPVKSELERNNPFLPDSDVRVASVLNLANNYQKRIEARLAEHSE